MFDNKTAQACWSGPASNSSSKDPYAPYGGSVTPDNSGNDPFLKGLAIQGSQTNSANIPFCKDLK
jgi:hypothetical protein